MIDAYAISKIECETPKNVIIILDLDNDLNVIDPPIKRILYLANWIEALKRKS